MSGAAAISLRKLIHLQNIESALSYSVLAAGLATAGIAAYMVVLCHTPLPWADGWGEIFAAASGERLLSLPWLWAQHNEHRLLIPKLFLIADLRFFQARQTFLLAGIYAIQLLHLCLLSWSARLFGWSGPQWRTATGLAALCLFCPTQWENLTWGFQTCFVLPPLFATLSFVGLLLYWRATGPHAWKFILLSVVAALAAVCSLASGLILLPLLAVTALVLGLGEPVVLTYLSAAVATTALYLHGYTRPVQNSDPLSTLRTPGRLLGYLLTYLGSTWPVGPSWSSHNLQIAPWIGAAGLALWLLLILRIRRMAATREMFGVQLALLSVFCLGTALLTALGRAQSGSSQAFASRYQTVALLFWFSLACLLLAASKRPLVTPALQALLLLVLIRGALLVHLPLHDAREHAFQMRAATAALLTGINDRKQIAEAYPVPDEVLQVVPFMREERLSIFSGDEPELLGQRLYPIARIADEHRCEAEVQVQTIFRDDHNRVVGIRFSGWVWDKQRRSPAKTILMVANERIVGFGAVGDQRPAIRGEHPEMSTSFVGFTAYAKHLDLGVTPYATVGGTPPEACEIPALFRFETVPGDFFEVSPQ